MINGNKTAKKLEVHNLGSKGFGVIAAQPIAAGLFESFSMLC